jgi:ketosteroid isomerase-like protein
MEWWMTNAQDWLSGLIAATNRHDLEALVGCFAEDYVNETPAHPARSFRGRDQVRRNWEQIFGLVPDLDAQVRATSVNGGEVWTELEMRGTRRDGSAHRMTGVIIFGVADGLARRGRFFLEPVDDSLATVDQTIREQLARP